MGDFPEPHEARALYLDNVVIPFVNAVARYSDSPFNRAVMYVAQYWDDEADDAVHEKFLFCPDGPPVTLETLSDFYAAEVQGGMWDEELDCRTFRDGAEVDRWSTRGRYGVTRSWPKDVEPHYQYDYMLPWDDNGIAVYLWSRWCKDNCHQEMDFGEAYTAAVAFDIAECDGCDMPDDVVHRRTVTGLTIVPALRSYEGDPIYDGDTPPTYWARYLDPWTPGVDRRQFWS